MSWGIKVLREADADADDADSDEELDMVDDTVEAPERLDLAWCDCCIVIAPCCGEDMVLIVGMGCQLLGEKGVFVFSARVKAVRLHHN